MHLGILHICKPICYNVGYNIAKHLQHVQCCTKIALSVLDPTVSQLPKYLVHVSSLASPRLNQNSCHLALNFCVHACEIANLEQIRSPHRQKPAFPAGNGLDRPKFSPYCYTISSGRAPGDGPGTAKVIYPLERKGQIYVPFCARDIGLVSWISDLCPGYVNRFKF